MERKRRGSGRLRQLPSGRWQAAYIGPDAKLHKAPRTYASEHDAEGWLAGERRAESTTVSVHRIESDSSLDGMLGVDRRAQSLEIADRCVCTESPLQRENPYRCRSARRSFADGSHS